jgi:hypothetical protein
MDNVTWSSGFARRIAQTLGYRLPGECGEGSLVDYDSEAERIVGEITGAFRHLPGGKIQCALDFAEFLRAKIDSSFCPPPAMHVADKLREVRDLVMALRDRHGTDRPADEADYWTEGDERDLSAQTWRNREDDPGVKENS